MISLTGNSVIRVNARDFGVPKPDPLTMNPTLAWWRPFGVRFFQKTLLWLAVLIGGLAITLNANADNTPAAHTFAIGTNDFLLDGKRLQIRCGEIHAARVPMEYWRHRLQMAKAMGLNTVCAYLFWNLHEPKPGEYVWTGQADDAEFCH